MDIPTRDVPLHDDLDPLTGVPRSGAFQECLDRCDRAAREAVANASVRSEDAAAGWYGVAIVEIVGLRAINQRHGVAVGDAVLCETAQRLTERLCNTFVARVGADKFALLFPSVARWDAGQVCRVVRRNALDGPIVVGDAVFDVRYRLTARTGPVVGDLPADGQWPLGTNMLWRVQHAATQDATRPLKQRLRALERAYREVTHAEFDTVMDLRIKLDRSERLRRTDPLTQLLNRRGLRDRLDELDASYVLAFVDLDDLRALNGHDDEAWEAGDTALVGLADLLRDEFGDPNVARWGGDEYLVVVPNTILERGIVTRLDILQERSRHEIVVGETAVTFSGGVAACPNGDDKAALRLAHRATKIAKQTKATVLAAGDLDFSPS